MTLGFVFLFFGLMAFFSLFLCAVNEKLSIFLAAFCFFMFIFFAIFFQIQDYHFEKTVSRNSFPTSTNVSIYNLEDFYLDGDYFYYTYKGKEHRTHLIDGILENDRIIFDRLEIIVSPDNKNRVKFEIRNFEENTLFENFISYTYIYLNEEDFKFMKNEVISLEKLY